MLRCSDYWNYPKVAMTSRLQGRPEAAVTTKLSSTCQARAQQGSLAEDIHHAMAQRGLKLGVGSSKLEELSYSLCSVVQCRKPQVAVSFLPLVERRGVWRTP